MGIAGRVLRVQPYQAHQLQDAVSPLRAAAVKLMDIQRLADDVFHRHTRIQGRIGILEYHLHLLPKRMNIPGGYLLAFKADGAAGGLVKS